MDYIKILRLLFLLSLIYLTLSAVGTQLFDKSSDALVGSGEYLVGKDIPAGEYYVKCKGFNLYVEDAYDLSGNYNSIIYYVSSFGGSYVTVKEGEYLKIYGGELYELDKAPKDKTEDGYYRDGMFKVGTDIPAGEYIVESSGTGYVEISQDSRHSMNGIVNYDYFEGNKYIFLQEGQYLTLRNDTKIKA